jgi:hypothetical protein
LQSSASPKNCDKRLLASESSPIVYRNDQSIRPLVARIIKPLVVRTIRPLVVRIIRSLVVRIIKLLVVRIIKPLIVRTKLPREVCRYLCR